MQNNEIKEFQGNISNIFRGSSNTCNIQEITYLLGYLSYMDCKLENSPYLKFSNENLDDSFGSVINSLMKSLEKIKSNKLFIMDNIKYIEKSINHLGRYSHIKVNTSLLMEVLKKYDIYFYEKLLRTNFVYDIGIRNYDFNTPNELIEIIKYFSKNAKKVFDIGCGSGNTLISLKSENNNIKCDGIDINSSQCLITAIRLSTFGYESNIINNDYFNISIDDKYSLAICNMPFGLRMDRMRRDEVLRYFNENFNIKFNPASSMEWLLVYKSLSILDSKGKLALITPLAPLFKDADTTLRRTLIDQNLIDYIIELPIGTYAGTEIPYCIVVLDKNKQDNSVKFVDASNCMVLDNHNKKVDYNKVINMLDNNSLKEIGLDLIASNNYNLQPSKYFNNEKKSQLQNATKLSDLKVEVLRGFQNFTKNDAVEDGKYSIVTIGDIDDGGNLSKTLLRLNTIRDVSKFILQEKDIIISTKGTKIKICYVENLKNKGTLFHGNLSVIRCNDNRLNPMYLKIYLESERGQLELNSIQTGTAIITINLSQLSNIEIPLLDIETQNKIVSNYVFKKKELDILDRKISELRSSLIDNVNNIFNGSDISG